MAYDTKRVWGSYLICQHCKNPLMYQSFMLVTSCPYGVWYYCPKCADYKGYTVKQDFKGNLPIMDENILNELQEKIPYFSGNLR